MFQDKLKELREKANMSQQTLADKLFVSRSAVAKWENGNGVPSVYCLIFPKMSYLEMKLLVNLERQKKLKTNTKKYF